MSSTNVHSEKENNMYCAGAQMIATDREVEIPPQTAKLGPTRYEVKLGEGMEIPVGNSELHRDGKLVSKDGTTVAKFDKNAFARIQAKQQREESRKKGEILEEKYGRKLVDKDENPIHPSASTHDLPDFATISKASTRKGEEAEK